MISALTSSHGPQLVFLSRSPTNSQPHRPVQGLAITVEARWPVTLASQAWKSCNQDQAVSARGNGKLLGPAYRAGGPGSQLDPGRLSFGIEQTTAATGKIATNTNEHDCLCLNPLFVVVCRSAYGSRPSIRGGINGRVWPCRAGHVCSLPTFRHTYPDRYFDPT